MYKNRRDEGNNNENHRGRMGFRKSVSPFEERMIYGQTWDHLLGLYPNQSSGK